ncbi:hypothetical protein E4U55_005844 [Claviceps digitariae]|nr:hypothetical protein E4U55_005844 [Claviceps digitariae]
MSVVNLGIVRRQMEVPPPAFEMDCVRPLVRFSLHCNIKLVWRRTKKNRAYVSNTAPIDNQICLDIIPYAHVQEKLFRATRLRESEVVEIAFRVMLRDATSFSIATRS